jgi:hypothetical protein
MEKISRRQLLQRASAGAAFATLGTNASYSVALSPHEVSSSLKPSFEWIRSVRLMIAEGYAPPFYPSLDYEPEKALEIARRLNCNAIRYPTFSYVAYFPTQTKLPHHPELGDRDPFRRTVDLFHAAGLKVVAYNPLNHPFMDVHSANPLYRDWMRYDADGQPYVTRHMGWTTFNEGCLNSPLREEIQKRVREVVTNYPVDLMYFDGPYQGMDQRMHYCHCQHCQAAYQKARGKSIPLQNAATTKEDDFEYQQWLTQEVIEKFMREICEMVRQVRDVPIVYNDTGLLGGDWRSRAYRYVDGFMFEAADTPEEKLFNLRVGQSTGKVIWTYISSHTEYNCQHLKDKTVRGWYSAPVEGERLRLDAAVATAAGAGYCYWGLNRLFYQPPEVLDGPVVRGLKSVLDFAAEHETLLLSVTPQPQAGILTGAQTNQYYQGEKFVAANYRNYYCGAYQLLKDLSYDAEPFLDFEMTAERLTKYRLVYAPNVACLSDAQCAMLTKYVEDGGSLLATHLTSVADEFGHVRKNYGLAELFGAALISAEPVEIPDLYLRSARPDLVIPPLSFGQLIPQDPQVMLFQASGAEVLAETYDRGHRRTLGPAVIGRHQGKGSVVYIGSGLEAIYEETLNESLRTYVGSLLAPPLRATRTCEIEYRPGLSSQFAASPDVLLLHLFANTGNIWKKLLVQESFLPIANVRVRLRIPQGRTAKSASLLWSGSAPSWKVANGWVELTIPQVHPYEVVRVDLQS